MSEIPAGIGPLSVRYAAQIRELLHSQAMDRMAADEEAARSAAQAEKAARLKPPEQPVKIDLEVKPAADAKPAADPVAQPAAQSGPAKLVDIQV